MKKAAADGMVAEVLAELDEEIAGALVGVTVYAIDGTADPELRDALKNAGIQRWEFPRSFRGVFLGTPRDDYDEEGGGEAQGSIVINAPNMETLDDVRDTLAHEIGHALGLSEEEVENLGLG